MIYDRNIAWRRKVITRWAKDFLSQSVGVLSGGPPADTFTTTDTANSNVTAVEISTSGFVGLKMSTDGYFAQDLLFLEDTMNLAAKLQIRVIYATGSSTNTDSVHWKILYKDIAAGSALAAGNTALDLAIADDQVPATAHSLAFSPWGEVDLGGIGRSTTPHMLSLVIEMDTKTDITEDIYCIGYQVSYAPMECEAPHAPYFEQAKQSGLIGDA